PLSDGRDPALEPREPGLREDREERGGDGSRQDLPRVDGRDAAEDEDAEAAGPDRRRDRRRADRRDRGDADPRQARARGERQLDDDEALPIGHPHRDGGFEDRRVDAEDADDGVPDDRQEGVEDERDDRGTL